MAFLRLSCLKFYHHSRWVPYLHCGWYARWTIRCLCILEDGFEGWFSPNSHDPLQISSKQPSRLMQDITSLFLCPLDCATPLIHFKAKMNSILKTFLCRFVTVFLMSSSFTVLLWRNTFKILDLFLVSGWSLSISKKNINVCLRGQKWLILIILLLHREFSQ